MSADRFDIIIVHKNPRQRFADGSISALLRNFAITRLALPEAEAVAQEWAEIYCAPTNSSHEIFVEGQKREEGEAFLQLTVHASNHLETLPFGNDEVEAAFWIAIYGAYTDTPHGVFLHRLKDVMLVDAQVYVQDHAGIPEHRVVPEGEERKAKKKLGPRKGAGMVGTRVEEL